jgi:hypothetical protein
MWVHSATTATGCATVLRKKSDCNLKCLQPDTSLDGRFHFILIIIIVLILILILKILSPRQPHGSEGRRD